MDSKGQARMLEIGMVLVVALFGAMLLGRIASQRIDIRADPALRNFAYDTLASLEASGSLFQAMYGQKGSGDPELLRAAISSSLPSGMGFNATVVDVDMNRLFSVASRSYDPTVAVSVAYFYYGKDGMLDPKIIILSLSGDS